MHATTVLNNKNPLVTNILKLLEPAPRLHYKTASNIRNIEQITRGQYACKKDGIAWGFSILEIKY